MSELSYPAMDEEGKVSCQICGKTFEKITPQHLGMHNIKIKEYRLRFPDVPLEGSNFQTRAKYRYSKIFENKNESIKENVEKLEDVIYDFPEEVLVEQEEPIFEEIEIPKAEIDPIKNKKSEILNILKHFYTNIKENYLIRKLSITHHLEFEFISDFADPVLKVNVQFPKTFWHNRDKYLDLRRNQKLTENGWKIIEINSLSPSPREIEKAIFNNA